MNAPWIYFGCPHFKGGCSTIFLLFTVCCAGNGVVLGMYCTSLNGCVVLEAIQLLRVRTSLTLIGTQHSM